MWMKIPNMCTEKEQNIVYCNSLYFELYLYVRKVKAVWKFKNPVKGKTRVWKQPSLGAAITDCTIYSYSVCMSNAANNKTFLYLPLPPVEICKRNGSMGRLKDDIFFTEIKPKSISDYCQNPWTWTILAWKCIPLSQSQILYGIGSPS